MFDRFRKRGLLPLAALTSAVMLGGCYYPGYQGYGYGGGYGGGYYAAPYYSGATVAVGGGWRGHDHHYDHEGWRR